MDTLKEARALAKRVDAGLTTLKRKTAAQRKHVAALKRQGIAAGTIYYRDERYAYLNHRQGAGPRRREYLGTSRAKLREAKARIKRFGEHAAAVALLQGLEAAMADVCISLQEAVRALRIDLQRGSRSWLWR